MNQKKERKQKKKSNPEEMFAHGRSIPALCDLSANLKSIASEKKKKNKDGFLYPRYIETTQYFSMFFIYTSPTFPELH